MRTGMHGCTRVAGPLHASCCMMAMGRLRATVRASGEGRLCAARLGLGATWVAHRHRCLPLPGTAQTGIAKGAAGCSCLRQWAAEALSPRLWGCRGSVRTVLPDSWLRACAVHDVC